MKTIKNLIPTLAILLCLVATVFGLASLDWVVALPWHGLPALIRFFGCIFVTVSLVMSFSIITKQSIFLWGLLFALFILIITGSLLPFIVVLWFFLASYLLGFWILRFIYIDSSDHLVMYSTLVGAGFYGSAVSILAIFPINFPGVYAVGLLLPILISGKDGIRRIVKLCKKIIFYSNDNGAAYLLDIGLVALSIIYLLGALQPEFGYDALVTHLFIPSQLFYRQQWGFDVSTYIWAVMPMLADWIFAIGYMLGGELAAKLINLGFMFILAFLVRDLAVWAGGSATTGRLAALLLLTTPLSFLEGTSLYVEGIWTAYLAGATLFTLKICSSVNQKDSHLLTAGVLLAFAFATKAISLLMLPLLAVVFLYSQRHWARRDMFWSLTVALSATTIFGGIPYMHSWWETGNPIFPFFNQIFQSPLYPNENFRDMRWSEGISWDFLYAVTFHSDRYQEAMPGASGFQWILLLIPASLVMVANKNWRGISLALLGLAFVGLVFNSASYLRYIFPAIAMLSAAVAVGVGQFLMHKSTYRLLMLGALGCALSLNVLFLNAASWYADFMLRPLFDARAREEYILRRLPERAAVELVNTLNITAKPVAFFSNPFGAGLRSSAIYVTWYNKKFLDSFRKIKTDEDAVNLLRSNSIEFIIFDDTLNKGGNYNLIKNVTTEISTFSNLSVRKINSEFLFREELLLNPYFNSKDGWYINPKAEWNEETRSVIVSQADPIVQEVSVDAGREYRNIVQAKCAGSAALGRLQINWYNKNKSYIGTEVTTFTCKQDWEEYQMTVVAPPFSAFGVVHTSAHSAERVAFRRNSLLR